MWAALPLVRCQLLRFGVPDALLSWRTMEDGNSYFLLGFNVDNVDSCRYIHDV